jgi:AcrR family transcriptional regulator
MSEHEPDKAGKRERTKQRNRSVILDAARLVFVEIGYDAATVRDIVGRTDLAPGTFYNYFPDKRSVLLALVGEWSTECSRRLREARASSHDIEQIVERGFRTYFEFIAGDRTLFELMRRNGSTLRTLGVDETGFAAGLEDLQQDIKRAMRAGLLPPLPITYMVRAIGAITFEIGAEMAAHDPPDVEGATLFASDAVLGALKRHTDKAFARAAGEAARKKTPDPETKPQKRSRKQRSE